MSDFELPEERGWAVYGQNPYTGKWRLDGATRSEMMVYTYAGESQRVEEVTIRPVSLGADPVQWAAVQMALALMQALRDMHIDIHHGGIRFSLSLKWSLGLTGIFGGSLEREP